MVQSAFRQNNGAVGGGGAGKGVGDPSGGGGGAFSKKKIKEGGETPGEFRNMPTLTKEKKRKEKGRIYP